MLKAQSIKNSKYVAIKCMKNHFDSLEQARFISSHLSRLGDMRQTAPPTALRNPYHPPHFCERAHTLLTHHTILLRAHACTRHATHTTPHTKHACWHARTPCPLPSPTTRHIPCTTQPPIHPLTLPHHIVSYPPLHHPPNSRPGTLTPSSPLQVNNLREIQALRRLSPHPGIIKLCEVLYDQPTRRLALVFELMDMNIYELIRGRRHYLPEARIKSYMYQLLKSMDHMHRNGIFHRDIKPENILITDDELKLADFGSCRGIYSKQPYTEYISTRWYRAPECLLTDGFYNYKMDMWGVGCVFFEVLSLYPLFPGTNELDQVC